MLLTRSGKYFDFLHPHPEAIDIEDIAHALANTCRFGGHTSQFYSVAQHCVRVSEIVPPQYALEGLLHDAAEAYIGDVVSPLKAMLPDYSVIEASIDRVVRTRFDLPLGLSDVVKAADLRMLATERRDLMTEHRTHWPILADVTPVDAGLVPIPPHLAKEMFLFHFELALEDYNSMRCDSHP